MTDLQGNILPILLLVTSIGFIPLAIVTMTGFLKISIVLFLVRNALGIQQSPPNLVLYGIALILTVYVTAPLVGNIYRAAETQSIDLSNVEGITRAANVVRGPLQEHLARYSTDSERQFFLQSTEGIWSEEARANVKPDDLVVLVPSFVSSELSRAFQIGFLLYIPFLVIDLIVSNVLMAMGMMMVSPTLISIPLKIFLFVSVDGWSRLMHGLILSYR
ncbi:MULTISPECIES: type III secretion system export apparatus subunit SctR [unclassified Phyllobacterium]|uniref:type III secretion system export apparatus subunit SctR n=1 Tax=Phyllobacterium TaxID=28100 RepID=UPI000888AC29|nr:MULTISPECIES: type III secretion system export apparatus subunit SctR [unclassified Phyllobacterium]MBA8901665.1 type III secretion protein R [Phyllobacterium sp. P30BS-XVII]UGX88925.1 type III secretion system export apparatus subunit SctR [Phyllobacterium sp. T1293]SDP45399.1 type III secretion protein R [Phyllobacterium sp. OV277]